ncbi:MAG: GerMN domain-containing protein [Candidatus Nomurabacteria bacterium]|nr:GerMN domain-containing protein [Candidatus Nomurabacteria bacterium]
MNKNKGSAIIALIIAVVVIAGVGIGVGVGVSQKNQNKQPILDETPFDPLNGITDPQEQPNNGQVNSQQPPAGQTNYSDNGISFTYPDNMVDEYNWSNPFMPTGGSVQPNAQHLITITRYIDEIYCTAADPSERPCDPQTRNPSIMWHILDTPITQIANSISVPTQSINFNSGSNQYAAISFDFGVEGEGVEQYLIDFGGNKTLLVTQRYIDEGSLPAWSSVQDFLTRSQQRALTHSILDTLVFTNTSATNPGSQRQSSQTMDIQLYFGNNITDPGVLNCQTTYPTTRTIPQTTGVARAALEQLIAGPTPAERTAGYITSVYSDFTIDSLSVSNGTAFVSFSAPSGFGPGGTCGYAMVQSQIRNTLIQFPTIQHIEIVEINGSPAQNTLQALI